MRARHFQGESGPGDSAAIREGVSSNIGHQQWNSSDRFGDAVAFSFPAGYIQYFIPNDVCGDLRARVIFARV
jgi:hypothetical protein